VGNWVKVVENGAELFGLAAVTLIMKRVQQNIDAGLPVRADALRKPHMYEFLLTKELRATKKLLEDKLIEHLDSMPADLDPDTEEEPEEVVSGTPTATPPALEHVPATPPARAEISLENELDAILGSDNEAQESAVPPPPRDGQNVSIAVPGKPPLSLWRECGAIWPSDVCPGQGRRGD
jgi:hypothetical protein